MHDAEYIAIPLRDRRGEVIAHALVDLEDAAQAEHRWYSDQGYATRRRPRNEGRFYLHREILGLAQDDPRHGDHINRDRLDNRRANLRIATMAQNRQNRGANQGSTSKWRGVSWCKFHGKWKAHVNLNGRPRHLGYFTDEEQAAAVASAFRAEHMPYSVEIP